MATKVTWTSTNPNYESFPIWYNKKIKNFTDAGNTAAVESWTAALAAKEAAMAEANYSAETPDNQTIITSSVVADVPAFNSIHQLWITECEVVFTTEEV